MFGLFQSCKAERHYGHVKVDRTDKTLPVSKFDDWLNSTFRLCFFDDSS